MNAEELKKRTKQFSLRVRSGTSVGANYRAACRGRSKAEFVAKMGICEEEADESAYWMELIIEGELLKKGQVAPLLKEAEELTKIFAQSRISASRSLLRAKMQKTNRQSAIGNRQ